MTDVTITTTVRPVTVTQSGISVGGPTQEVIEVIAPPNNEILVSLQSLGATGAQGPTGPAGPQGDSMPGSQAAPYNFNQMTESGSYTYFGYTNEDGDWYIKRLTLDRETLTHATVLNNPTVESYADAWTGKTGLTYARFDEAF